MSLYFWSISCLWIISSRLIVLPGAIIFPWWEGLRGFMILKAIPEGLTIPGRPGLRSKTKRRERSGGNISVIPGTSLFNRMYCDAVFCGFFLLGRMVASLGIATELFYMYLFFLSILFSFPSSLFNSREADRVCLASPLPGGFNSSTSTTSLWLRAVCCGVMTIVNLNNFFRTDERIAQNRTRFRGRSLFPRRCLLRWTPRS